MTKKDKEALKKKAIKKLENCQDPSLLEEIFTAKLLKEDVVFEKLQNIMDSTTRDPLERQEAALVLAKLL